MGYIETDTYAYSNGPSSDMPMATTMTQINVVNNTIIGPYDAVDIEQYAEADLAMSTATLNTTVNETFNNVTDAYDAGLYTDIWGYSELPGTVNVMATVTVTTT